MVKRKRWDLKHHQIEYRKVNLLGKALFNHLRILWFVSVEKVSGAGELPPCALSEPDLNLSAHPAPIIQPWV